MRRELRWHRRYCSRPPSASSRLTPPATRPRHLPRRPGRGDVRWQAGHRWWSPRDRDGHPRLPAPTVPPSATDLLLDGLAVRITDAYVAADTVRRALRVL